MARLDELQTEYRRLINSFEFAYAMGHTRTLGARDPRLEWVVQRVDELRREIADERRRSGGAGAPPL